MGAVRGEYLYFSVIFMLLGGRTDFNMVVAVRIMSNGVHGCWVSKGVICEPVVPLAEVHLSNICLAAFSLSAEASQLRIQKEEDYKDEKRRRRRTRTGEEEEKEEGEEDKGMRTRTRRKRRGGGLVEKEEEEAFIFLLISLLPVSIRLTLGCGHSTEAIG